MKQVIEILTTPIVYDKLPTRVDDLDVINYLLTRHHYSSIEDAKSDGAVETKKFKYTITIEVEEIK